MKNKRRQIVFWTKDNHIDIHGFIFTRNKIFIHQFVQKTLNNVVPSTEFCAIR